MRIFFPLFYFLMFSFISCNTLLPVSNKYEEVSYPELGVETVKNLGDVLVTQKYRVTTESVKLNKDIKVSFGGTIRSGTFPAFATRRTAKSETTLKNGHYGNSILFYVDSAHCNLFEAAIEYFEETKVFHPIGKNGYGMYANAGGNIDKSLCTLVQTTVEDNQNFEQTLVYLGRSGNTIKFAYREFIYDMARPAFTTDISYDLSENIVDVNGEKSTVVGFKDARLKIIEATNTSIKYILLNNFGGVGL